MRAFSIGMLSAIAVTTAAVGARAQTVVGTVTVCYYSPECNYADIPAVVHAPDEAQRFRDAGEHQGPRSAATTGSATPVDAPAFLFTNSGQTAITAASFSIVGNKSLGITRDVFHIGKIAPGATFVLVPGASNDKKTHPAGSFFTFTAPGSPLDTSDAGPDANAVKFMFAGKIGTQHVTSGVIATGKSVAPSQDGTVTSLNFLGGPENADAPCNDCVAPKIIANIVTTPAGADLPDDD